MTGLFASVSGSRINQRWWVCLLIAWYPCRWQTYFSRYLRHVVHSNFGITDALVRCNAVGASTPHAMEGAREMESMNGFNLYNTDEESQHPTYSATTALSKRARYCLLFLLAALVFVGGVWMFDSMLDWMDSSKDEGMQQSLQTGHSEDASQKLREARSTARPARICPDHIRIYSEKCSVPASTSPVAPCAVPACFSGDVDLGVSAVSDSSGTHEISPFVSRYQLGLPPTMLTKTPFERSCVSVPSLTDADELVNAEGAKIQCAGDLTQIHESQLPLEIHETHEWTSTVNEIIHLALWGGGGGGAGSMDAWIYFKFFSVFCLIHHTHRRPPDQPVCSCVDDTDLNSGCGLHWCSCLGLWRWRRGRSCSGTGLGVTGRVELPDRDWRGWRGWMAWNKGWQRLQHTLSRQTSWPILAAHSWSWRR